MKTSNWYLAVIIGFASCSDASTNSSTAIKQTDSINHEQPASPAATTRPPGPLLNEQIGNHINLAFAKDSSTLTTTGHLDTAFATVVCLLDIKKQAQLTATITPATGSGNIRFNQVFMPNGNADGPFGQQLDYMLKTPGLYKLIIGSSNMADSPYTGNFVLKVTVK